MHKQKNEKILGFHLQFCGCLTAGSKKALTQRGRGEERRGTERREEHKGCCREEGYDLLSLSL